MPVKIKKKSEYKSLHQNMLQTHAMTKTDAFNQTGMGHICLGGELEDIYDLSKFEGMNEDEILAILMNLNEEELQKYLPEKNSSVNNKKNLETNVKKEARLAIVHKMSLRGLTMEQMSAELGVSMRSIATYKKVINKRIKTNLTRIDFGVFAGETLSFYQDIQSTCMLYASSKTITDRARNAYLNTSMKAREQLINFLDRCGVIDAVRGNNPLVKNMGDASDKTNDSVSEILTELAMEFKDLGNQLNKEKIEQVEETKIIN